MMTGLSKSQLALCVSLAINLFLLAFMAGRMTAAPFMPMPPMPMAVPMMIGPGPMPPFGAQGPGGLGPSPMDHAGDMMPRPPIALLGKLFSPEELRQEFADVQQTFATMNKMRAEFARQLAAGPVTKDAVLQHFAATETLMTQSLRKLQTKVAERVSTLPDTERRDFAAKLLQESEPPELPR